VLRFESIALGDSGSFRCVRCRRAGDETLRGVTTVIENIREVAAAWNRGPGPNLSFTGAEPFRHPALFDLLDASVAAGASRIRLESDAQALGCDGTAERALRFGVRHLRFPLLGSVNELHDSLVGATGSLEATLAGVRRFIDVASKGGADVHITARVPVCRHNLHDTPGIVTLAAETGATSVLLTVDDVDLDLRQASSWLEAACDTGTVCATWVEVEGVPYGCASGWELHLASLYQKVAGDKPEWCRDCPLADVCSGAMPGASDRVLEKFATPPDAQRIAQRIAHCLEPLKAG
jgi:hypothetical protein